MWTVTAEAPADGIYRALKAAFDRKMVKKRPKTWTTMSRRKGVQEHTKGEHVPADEGGVSERDSLQFRVALKSAQQQVAYLDPDAVVKVTIKSDDKSLTTKVEVV